LTNTFAKSNNLLVNRLFRALIVVVFGILAVASCFDSKPARYSIQSSKSYEASMFRQNCAICHGPEGEGKTLDDGRIIPNIRDGEHKYNTREQIYDHITNGGNGMVPFRDILTEKERNSLVEFVLRDLRSAKP